MHNAKAGFSAVAVLILACSGHGQTYRVTDHWHVGGQGGWDYLLSDDSAHRLYIAHNSRVEAIDTTTGKSAGAITGLKSTHGIALNPDGHRGYISDGAGNAIVIFDRDSLAIQKTVPAGSNPDGITFEPMTKTVWAFNGRSNNVSVLDTAKDEVIATIALPGKPEFPQADGKGFVYVNIEDKNSIVKLDAKAHTVVGTWQLTGCESPSGLAIDRSKSRLFSVCDGKKMAVWDYSAGKLSELAPIGDGPDAAFFDAKTGLVFSSNGGDGTVSVLNTAAAHLTSVQTVTTARGGRTMAYDQTTGRIFVPAAKYGPAPAATAAVPRPRATIIPDSFEVLVLSK